LQPVGICSTPWEMAYQKVGPDSDKGMDEKRLPGHIKPPIAMRAAQQHANEEREPLLVWRSGLYSYENEGVFLC